MSDNPKAFPSNFPPAHEEGMTLRDYMAAAALTGIATTMNRDEVPLYHLMANDAYRFADAMLAARTQD